MEIKVRHDYYDGERWFALGNFGMFKLSRVSGVIKIDRSIQSRAKIKLIVDGSESEFSADASDEPLLDILFSDLKSLLLDPRPFVVEEQAENPATENAAEPEPCEATADEAAKR